VAFNTLHSVFTHSVSSRLACDESFGDDAKKTEYKSKFDVPTSSNSSYKSSYSSSSNGSGRGSAGMHQQQQQQQQIGIISCN
jgi:hypothetical protein